MQEKKLGGKNVHLPDSERTVCEVWTRRCNGVSEANEQL